MHAEAEAPCTVGNCGPGFDVLSLALERRGDRVSLYTADADKVTVRGPGAEKIPHEWSRNAACAAIDHLRHAYAIRAPLEVVVEKGMPPGSGLGSSASSSAAAVRAFARLHDVRIPPPVALAACGEGEAVATGSAHFDDVAAALYGGLTIVGGAGADSVIRLRPPRLSLVVVRPDVELPTKEMRALIPAALFRLDVIRNLSAVARVVHACHVNDAALLCRALDDRISRPYRAPRVPFFDDAEKAARAAGAQAFLLSGSGPAMIAAVLPNESAAPVEMALRELYQARGVAAEVFTTHPLAEVRDPAVPLP